MVLNTMGPLICKFFSNKYTESALRISRFCIHRFNQLQIENSIFHLWLGICCWETAAGNVKILFLILLWLNLRMRKSGMWCEGPVLLKKPAFKWTRTQFKPVVFKGQLRAIQNNAQCLHSKVRISGEVNLVRGNIIPEVSRNLFQLIWLISLGVLDFRGKDPRRANTSSSGFLSNENSNWCYSLVVRYPVIFALICSQQCSAKTPFT